MQRKLVGRVADVALQGSLLGQVEQMKRFLLHLKRAVSVVVARLQVRQQTLSGRWLSVGQGRMRKRNSCIDSLSLLVALVLVPILRVDVVVEDADLRS